MSASDHGVAINTDLAAPVFDAAHISVAGDLYESLPNWKPAPKPCQKGFRCDWGATAVEFMERAVISNAETYLYKHFPDISADAYLLAQLDGPATEAELRGKMVSPGIPSGMAAKKTVRRQKA